MARAESSLVIKRMPWHSTFTEMNHLGRSLIAKPKVFSDIFTQMFSSYNYSDNPLTSMLSGTGREVSIGGLEWSWGLRGASTRPLVYVGSAAGSAQGAGHAEFDLPLDENYFVAGDVIHPGNPAYQVRIQRNPYRSGHRWIYRVQPITTSATHSIPVAHLSPGAKWGKLFSQYEEGSEQGGSTQYALPLELKSRLTRFRKKYMVTGDAAQEVLAVKIPDSKGGQHMSWIKYAEVEFWKQWGKELERGMWYSRTDNQVQGSTGRPVYPGPGVQELLEDSHVHSYTTFSAKMVEEYLMDIFYSRVSPTSGARKLAGFTGEYGMLIFHRAVMDAFQKNGFITVDSNFIQSDSTPYHSNGLSFGAQFTRYKMANGTELTLIHNPLYDDREIHWDIDPVSGYPYESQRFTFLYLSGEGSDSNIKRVKKEGGMKLGYVAGMQTPYGPANNSLMSHSGDYYSMELMDYVGVHITDITKCGELILNRS